MNQALLIFIKNPEKGNVKTRLAATLGDDKALQVYKKLLAYTLKVVLAVNADRVVWYSHFVSEHDEWDESEFAKKVQHGNSLGERMKHAFRQVFKKGYKRAVIIGSDCAQIKPSHIEQAYQQLDRHDIVIGPSEDGGYYLLGMTQFFPTLFENKSWSTEKVLQQTLEECRNRDLSYHILETLNDVDTEADWDEVKDQF